MKKKTGTKQIKKTNKKKQKRISVKKKVIIVILAALTVATAAGIAYRMRGIGHVKILGAMKISYNTFHVQGLAVTDDYFYISSVNTSKKRGYLFKIDRRNLGLITKKNITEKRLYHPGGIHYDGIYLWVCLAKYSPRSRAKIIAYNPETLEVERSFYVKDHISFVVSDSAGKLYASDWGSRHLYVFDWDGHVLQKIKNPLPDRNYQDGCFEDNRLIVGCQTTGRIDVLDPEDLELIKSYRTERANIKDEMTREGLKIFRDNLFLMPEDGPNTTIYICNQPIR